MEVQEARRFTAAALAARCAQLAAATRLGHC
jgi:hypothetical protein